MSRTISKSKSFSFDDLHWSESEIAQTKQEAERFCAEHNGEIELKEGKLTYSLKGESRYNEPESWPRYVVCWEEEE